MISNLLQKCFLRSSSSMISPEVNTLPYFMSIEGSFSSHISHLLELAVKTANFVALIGAVAHAEEKFLFGLGHSRREFDR